MCQKINISLWGSFTDETYLAQDNLVDKFLISYQKKVNFFKQTPQFSVSEIGQIKASVKFIDLDNEKTLSLWTSLTTNLKTQLIFLKSPFVNTTTHPSLSTLKQHFYVLEDKFTQLINILNEQSKQI